MKKLIKPMSRPSIRKLGRPQSDTTIKALAMVKAGHTRYAAAIATGLSLSTVYRAFDRAKKEVVK